MYETRRRKRCAQVSKDIPQEILFEILLRLPVKSLLRFRCVCKSWNTLISKSSFINDHLERNVMKSSCDYLLIQTTDMKCLSLYTAETYAKCLDLELPRFKNGFYFSIYGSSNGLLCISDGKHGAFKSPIYLWNPSIRKVKRLPKSLIHGRYTRNSSSALGFARCRGNDYKVVRIVRFAHLQNIFNVEVYSLNMDSWRRISAVPPISHYGNLVHHACACLNGVVYWTIREYHPCRKSILSFDMDNELFENVMIPDSLQCPSNTISTRVFEKSLSLFNLREEGIDDRCCDIWVLEMDTWKMIRTVLLPSTGWIARPLGFTTNGVIHVEMPSENCEYGNLVLYDPKLQQVEDIGIKLEPRDFYDGSYIDAYRESLILLHS